MSSLRPSPLPPPPPAPWPSGTRVPFALYFAAVAFVAWRAGWLAGIAVGVAGVLTVAVHERFSGHLLAPSLVLLGVSAIISLLSATRERALTDLRESER